MNREKISESYYNPPCMSEHARTFHQTRMGKKVTMKEGNGM